ncbi:MAG: PilX N-terminal domain-containing pilus assembly protein [Magnetococcus sp. WYHC-3]
MPAASPEPPPRDMSGRTPGPAAGSVLLVALVILALLSLLAVQGLHTAGLEEQMARGHQQRALAFQQAEAALRAGESWLETYVGPPRPPTAVATCPTPPCSVWQWNTPDADADGLPDLPDNIARDSWWQAHGVPYDNTSQAWYLIEERPATVMDSVGESLVVGQGGLSVAPATVHFYRITARSSGPAGTASVVVQSNYAKAF